MFVLSTDIDQIKSEVLKTLVRSREGGSGVLQMQLLAFTRVPTTGHLKPLSLLWRYRWFFNLILQQLLYTESVHLALHMTNHCFEYALCEWWLTDLESHPILIWQSTENLYELAESLSKWLVWTFWPHICMLLWRNITHIKTWSSDLCFNSNSNNHKILLLVVERVLSGTWDFWPFLTCSDHFSLSSLALNKCIGNYIVRAESRQATLSNSDKQDPSTQSSNISESLDKRHHCAWRDDILANEFFSEMMKHNDNNKI